MDSEAQASVSHSALFQEFTSLINPHLPMLPVWVSLHPDSVVCRANSSWRHACLISGGGLPLCIATQTQFSSVIQSCPILYDPMNRSMPGLPVHHKLPEFTQTHVHRVSDAIQTSHPLSSPSPPAPNPSQHQGLFQWVSSSHEVAKVLVPASASVLPMDTQDWSPLGWTVWISLQSKGLSRVFSNTTVQKHQFFGTQLSSQSNSHIHTRPLEKP